MPTRTVQGVEIFSVGEWTDSSGQTKGWTAADIAAIMQDFRSNGSSSGVPLKVGHTSDAFNKRGADALGLPSEVV